MSSAVWLPGLIVLAAGLAAGWWAVRRLSRAPGRSGNASRGRGTAAAPGRAAAADDLELEIADLEARKEELYARLRGLPGEVHDSGEREALERAAARTLRELDRASERLAALAPAAPSRAAKARPRREEPAAEAPPETAPAPSRRPALGAFLAGAVTMALIAALVYWAGRDAAPRPDEAARGGGQASQGLPPDHPPVDGSLPPEVGERVSALEARLAGDPEDIMARKELALTLLAGGRYVEAYEQGDALLERIPEDPDALFVQGVVRLAMGQNDEAVELLDRVLARFPEHQQALVYRGLALYQAGEVERALDTWELGLERAGGSQPELERLIRMAREQGPPPAGLAPPEAEERAASAPAAPADPPAAPPVAGVSGGYAVRIELDGPPPAPGASLFVFLRPEGGGPPVAVRKIDGPRFPLDLVLDAGDSMMGQELPTAGILVARLDADGSASTRDPSDLAAESTARRGEATRLVLSN